jgi:riboflavin kinase/FMN adenylyltransferase
MYIYRTIRALPAFRNAVLTIGTFDGVHTGHVQLLDQLKEEAARVGGETVIVTFHPHPRQVVKGGGGSVRLINSLEEKIGLLSRKDVDHLVIVPFTTAFSELTAEQYVKEFLLQNFHPHTIIIGYDHRFGKGRAGDFRLLEKFSREEGFELKEIPVHVLDAISVSSTRIREAIASSDLETANQLLGYDFFFSGKVVQGDRLGRTIGYPTANLRIGDAEKLQPGDGVYAVEVELLADEKESEWVEEGGDGREPLRVFDVPGARLKGMMNVGMRPTVSGRQHTTEVNIFDFDEDIYGRTLRIFMKKHLRAEQKFSGLQALQQQLAIDRRRALELLS